VRANTSIELGRVKTATLEIDPKSMRDSRGWASIVIHEAFHAFQRERHPKWSGNEAELFLYPMEDAGPLAVRRLETEAFRRALAAKESKEAACWTSRALDKRRDHRRFVKLGNEDSTLEVLGREALTQAAGEHPLFNGVRDLQVTGLPVEPKVTQEGDFVVIAAEGITARLKGAKVEKGERALKVTVP
jgi:hypothetical protein